MSTFHNHQNIFHELDEACLWYPADVQTQPYRLTIDFTRLSDIRNLVEECADSVEVHGEGDCAMFEDLLSLFDDIFEQRIPNPGGPQ